MPLGSYIVPLPVTELRDLPLREAVLELLEENSVALLDKLAANSGDGQMTEIQRDGECLAIVQTLHVLKSLALLIQSEGGDDGMPWTNAPSAPRFELN